MTESAPSPPPERSPRWPWACLAAALAWAILVRVPLILNAETHLDSDLAVDGLTLLETTQGHLRWHFPGTPHMGIAPLFLAVPQAMAFGANAFTVASGGVVAFLLVMVSVFLLAWRVFGPRVAAWSLVPLAFSSVGTIWLSGRLTGGHLLTVAWYAAALNLLAGVIDRGGISRTFALGVWCGFGFYLDQMTLSAMAGMLPVLLALLKTGGHWGRGVLAVAAFAAGFAIGDLPREVGYRVDPHDAYAEQFATIFDEGVSGSKDSPKYWVNVRKLVGIHYRILALECVPRLVWGHVLPSQESRPLPDALPGGSPGAFRPPSPVVAGSVSVVSLGLLLASAIVLCDVRGPNRAAVGVRMAVILTGAAVLGGFLLNRNIFNSDNYRYLVLLLVPWCLGFGLFLAILGRLGGGGTLAAALVAGAFIGSTTLDTVDWYQRFGWLDRAGRPVRVPLKDPALTWLREHPEQTAMVGGYWDVYRLSLLTGGRVKGVPYPDSHDRFDEARNFPGYMPRLLIARANDNGSYYAPYALSHGGTLLHRSRSVMIIDWPPAP